MRSAKISAFAAAALIAAPSVATAGPLLIARGEAVAAPPEAQIEPVHYARKKHRHRYVGRAPAPGRAVVGTAAGLAGVGVNTAVGTAHVLGHGWCDFWGYCR